MSPRGATDEIEISLLANRCSFIFYMHFFNYKINLYYKDNRKHV